MLTQGFQYMIIGMGVVFFFLIIMVISMHIMSAVIAGYNSIYPEPVEEEQQTPTLDNNQEVAVVLAAVKAFS